MPGPEPVLVISGRPNCMRFGQASVSAQRHPGPWTGWGPAKPIRKLAVPGTSTSVRTADGQILVRTREELLHRRFAAQTTGIVRAELQMAPMARLTNSTACRLHAELLAPWDGLQSDTVAGRNALHVEGHTACR